MIEVMLEKVSFLHFFLLFRKNALFPPLPAGVFHREQPSVVKAKVDQRPTVEEAILSSLMKLQLGGQSSLQASFSTVKIKRIVVYHIGKD